MAMKKQPKTPNLTRNASQPQRGGDYNMEAHTQRHHTETKDGQAFGKPNDTAPMDYTRKTNAEGAKSEPVAGHPGLSNPKPGAAHLVGSSRTPATGAHSIGGHAAHVRSGVLRNSGHPGAHRIGKK